MAEAEIDLKYFSDFLRSHSINLFTWSPTCNSKDFIISLATTPQRSEMKLSECALLSTSVSKFDHNTVIKILLINYIAVECIFHFSYVFFSSISLQLLACLSRRLVACARLRNIIFHFSSKLFCCRQIKISRQQYKTKQQPRQRRRCQEEMRNSFHLANIIGEAKSKEKRWPTMGILPVHRWWFSDLGTMMSLQKCSKCQAMARQLTQFSRSRPLIISIVQTHSTAS